MIYVAKSYKDLEKIGEPYIKSNRSYIKVRTKTGGEKEVRVYTEAEYRKMYPEEEVKTTGYVVKDILGFGPTNSVWLARGNEEWLKRSPCRFHTSFGWYYASHFGTIGEPLPDEIEMTVLCWDKVGNVDGTLKPKEEVVKVVKKCWELSSQSQ